MCLCRRKLVNRNLLTQEIWFREKSYLALELWSLILALSLSYLPQDTREVTQVSKPSIPTLQNTD